MPPKFTPESHVPLSASSAGRLRAIFYLRVSTKAQVRTDYDPEGISLPAQRVACGAKAETLNADMVGEYVEPGASAHKNLERREAFRDMIARIERDRDVDIVIVYQLSRFARDRYEDAAFTLRLRNLGVVLVSATENIDETPAGELLHGMLAVINQYQSAASGKDISYKMRQKAANGGTPGLAPIGYLNVRIRSEGRNIADVILDEDRWRLVQWAFEQFATGAWTVDSLTDELNHRGLTNRAAGKRPERPLQPSHVHKMLTNRYYIGVVTFDGVEYPGGRHPTFVTEKTLTRVQGILRSRATAGDKPSKHFHPLKGSLFCGQCGSGFGIMNATGRGGGKYPYFYCLGRQRGNCGQPYVMIEVVEQLVADWWRRVEITPRQKSRIRDIVLDSAQTLVTNGTEQADQQKRRINALEDERRACMRAYYNGAISQEFLKEEQQRIDRDLGKARALLHASEGEWQSIGAILDRLLSLCEDSHTLYTTAPALVQRQLNQAVFKRFWIIDKGIHGADLFPPLAQLLGDDLADLLSQETRNLIKAQSATDEPGPPDLHVSTSEGPPTAHEDGRPLHGQTKAPSGIYPNGATPYQLKRSEDQVSNIATLVDLGGLEPPASSLSGKRSNRLSYRSRQRLQPYRTAGPGWRPPPSVGATGR